MILSVLILSVALASQDPEAMLERFDENDDGKLACDELPESLRARCSTIDTNDDELIDEDELKQMILRRRAARLGPGSLMRRLMELDEDGDDRIHRDEVPEEMENLRAMFDDVDENDDDYIDARELARLQRRLRR